MIYLVLLFIEVSILFFFSRSMSKTLSKFMSINLMSFVFLPGVIVHELSHFFIATILFVPVGNMEFIPKKSASGVRLGSVEIGKTDPIRRSIIGFAPVFVGLMIVIGIVYLFTSNILFLKDKNLYLIAGIFLAIIYMLFAISNTMFSSPKDMEGTVEILITLLILFSVAYILGFRPELSFVEKIFTEQVIDLLQKSTIFLLVPIVIDLFILGIIKLVRR